MSKNIVLIQSHCDTIEKKEVLIQNLKKLKNYNLDILLYSHIPLPEEIIKEVDYFIYDKSNPIMWEERRHYYWWACDKYKFESTVPDYGWTVFNQIIGAHNFIKDKDYENIIIFCYDVIIDSITEEYLNNPRPQLFEHRKPPKHDEHGNLIPVILGTALVFLILKKVDFINLISSLSKKEYAENYGLIAEKYLEKKLNELNIFEKSTIPVSDLLHESKNIFNCSDSVHYNLFLDNQNLLKFVFNNKTSENIKIIINEELIISKPGEIIYNKKIENLKTFGCLIFDEFHDLKKILKKQKINQITFF